MNKEEFLNELKIAINTDNELNENTILNDIAEWDSLAVMCTVTLFAEQLNTPITFEEIKNLKTIKDLINKAKIK